MNYSFLSLNSTGNSTNVGATIYSPIIMCLAGVLGNVLALVVLHRTRRECQRLMFHGLVGGLAWNDLLGIVLTTPVTLVSYANKLEMPGGEHLCRFNGFVMLCFGISTPLIVTAMAIERYLFVKHTFFYTRHCSPNNARLIILAIWGFILLFGLLPLFGFGKYVLQYPQTWCFLNFKTTSSVDAAYAYLFAFLNLLLAVVTVVCNLVVVATLARVRDYRRKHSNSSLNMALVMEGDDCCKSQTKKRKQKDMELQMICVMVAITTIFVVCWCPLMIHIIYTLVNGGVSNPLLGLLAIRLASLNQTLNPWLYVIIRRTLVVRVKKFCCRCKKEKRKRVIQSGHPAGKRHQYVHVGHRLCHRNNFVGVDANSQSLSDSMRKSLHRAIPAAMSLPDVMMVNTGRRDLDMPLPDVAKAQSYAGRVSHGTWGCNNDSRSCYCDCPSGSSQCSQCGRERAMARETHNKMIAKDADLDDRLPDSQRMTLKSNDAVGFGSKFVRNNYGNEGVKYRRRNSSSDSPYIVEGAYDRTDVTDRLHSKPPSGRRDLTQMREFQSSIKNSSSSRDRRRTDSQRSNDGDIHPSVFSPSNRSSFHSQTGNPALKGAMTQYIHLQKWDSQGSPVVAPSIKSHSDDSNKQVSATLLSEDITFNSPETEYNPNVFEEDIGDIGTSNSKIDNTTDCGVFSSNPTESVCFSDANYGPSSTEIRKPFSHHKFDPHCCEHFNECTNCPLTQLHQMHADAYQKLGKQARTRSKSYTNDGCEISSVELQPGVDRPVSVDEERSSGVFSVESPTKLKNEVDIKTALWETKLESKPVESSNSKSHLKQIVRRIKSAT